MKRDISPSTYRWRVIHSYFGNKPHDLYAMEALNFEWEHDLPNGPRHYITGSLSEIKDRVERAAEGVLDQNSEGVHIFCNKLKINDEEVYTIDVISKRRLWGIYTLASVHIAPY